MFSILYSAGLRISELLELKPGDINEPRSLIRVRQGKGKKDRYTLLSKPLMKKLTEYNRLYKPKVWLFEHRPGEPFTESIVSKRLKLRLGKRESRNGFIRTCCAIRSPPTCWSKEPTSKL